MSQFASILMQSVAGNVVFQSSVSLIKIKNHLLHSLEKEIHTIMSIILNEMNRVCTELR